MQRVLVKFWCVCAVVLVLFSRCGNDPVENPSDASQDSTITAYLEQVGNDSASRDANGIYYYPIVLNPGGNTASNGVLSIYYTARVLGSSIPIDIFDRNDGDPLVLRQGANAVYPVGLDLILPVMNEGDTYGFIIPSYLAYDTLEFSTLIPANSIIEFEVELVQVRSESEVVVEEGNAINQYIDDALLDDLSLNPLDSVERLGQTGSVIYKRLVAGQAGRTPTSGQLIRINYQGRLLEDSSVFDNRFLNLAFEYPFNTNTVIPGLDLGIAEMEVGEEALLIIPSFFAYRESAVVIPGYLVDEAITSFIVPDYAARVGAYQTLIFEVELLDGI